ncbi:cell division protein Fic [Clostridia bacterium]|nr:cell division protein Fic [Clostridia bacterium]
MYKPNYTVRNEVLNNVAEIESIWTTVKHAHILPERQIEMRYRATVEKTYYSTSIEGNRLTLKQVDAAFAGKTLTRHEYAVWEVRGYKKALDFIEKRKLTGVRFSKEDLLKLHSLAMTGLISEEKTGVYRKGDIYIVDQDDRVKYQGPPAKKTARLVDDLLTWLQAGAQDIHPCIVSGILHYQLVTIHPFSDGNGRTARLAVMLYLGLQDYDFNSAIVLDTYYADGKQEYYATLHACQGGDYNENTDLSSWLKYYTDGFLSSAKVLSAEIKIMSLLSQDRGQTRMSVDESDLLSYAKEFGGLTVSDACDILKDTPRRTVQRKLKKLVDDGYLAVRGAGKSTIYKWRE